MGSLQIIFDGEVASRVFDHLNISSISSTSSSERASASQQDLQNKNILLQTFSKKIRAKEKVKHREIFKAILNMALINSHTLKNQNAASCKKKVLITLSVRGSQYLHKINEYIQEILQPCVQRHPDIQLGVGSNVLLFYLNGICLPI